MAKLKAVKADRWLTPLPGFDELQVQVHRPTQHEITGVYHKHGIRVGGKDGTPYEKNQRVNDDLIDLWIADFKGFVDEENNDVACDLDGKLKLCNQQVKDERNGDGEVRPMFQIILACLEAAEEAERKN